jgi:hypothetical protein
VRQVLGGVIVAGLVAVTGGAARAQVGAGQITGIVSDSEGGAVPGATVTATSEGTANLGNPNGTFGGSTFGSITTALDPRVVQLAVKVLF